MVKPPDPSTKTCVRMIPRCHVSKKWDQNESEVNQQTVCVFVSPLDIEKSNPQKSGEWKKNCKNTFMEAAGQSALVMACGCL